MLFTDSPAAVWYHSKMVQRNMDLRGAAGKRDVDFNSNANGAKKPKTIGKNMKS